MAKMNERQVRADERIKVADIIEKAATGQAGPRADALRDVAKALRLEVDVLVSAGLDSLIADAMRAQDKAQKA